MYEKKNCCKAYCNILQKTSISHSFLPSLHYDIVMDDFETNEYNNVYNF